MNVPKQEIMRRISKHLSGKLRIEDWDIDIDCVTMADLIDSYGREALITRGDCERDLKHNEAYIRINKDFDPNGKIGNDGELWWYKTLVHELYHVVTARYELYACNAVGHLESQSLIDNTHTNMTIEYENVVATFAKIFVDVYPLSTCLRDMGMSWEEMKA